MTEYYYSSPAFLLLCLFGISSISLSRAHNGGGFSVELIHRESSRSPFYLPTETQSQRVANAIRRSINRAGHLNKASSIPTKTPETTVIPDRGEYLMACSVGTPPFKLFGIVDTGSDIVWLQCKPCEACYNQTTPIFDPSKSTTHKTIPCTSETCMNSSDTTCSPDGKRICQYNIDYGDQSHSQGDLVLETLTLDSTSGSPIPFPKTLVGCGHINSVSFRGRSSGVVGLGGGPLSLITQLGPSIGGKFSYCLAPMFTQSNTSSKLNFGDNVGVSGRGTVSTPLVYKRQFYYLTLEAFSVGDNKLDFGSQKGNIIIDSGTTLTILPPDLYNKLESAVKNAVKLERVEDPSHQLPLCYRATSKNLEVPIMTAHFDGADVQLNALNTFVQVDDEVACLAFGPTAQGFSIFGNLAQQNFLVGYDLQKDIVSFSPTDCTEQ